MSECNLSIENKVLRNEVNEPDEKRIRLARGVENTTNTKNELNQKQDVASEINLSGKESNELKGILRLQSSNQNVSTYSNNIKENNSLKTTIGNEVPVEQALSKSKRKKLLKLQKWEIKKVEKRRQEREKQRKKKQEARENGVPYRTGPSRKALKHVKMEKSACSITVAIDLSFDHLMIDKDIAKVVKQLLRTYTLNRRAVNPIQLVFTSLKEGGKMHTAISKHDGYKNWDVRIEAKPFQDIFPHSNICYLTSESDNVLTSLDPDGIYIIGGLVDHNAHKGLCFKTAKEMNLKHAQLPLDQLLKMKTRRVLTIDHVFEILLRVTEGKTWTESFLQVLPMRKGASAVEQDTHKSIDIITEEPAS